MNKSKQDFLPFALPEIGEEEIAEVVNALRSGWVTTGPKAKQFETDFVSFLGGGGGSCGRELGHGRPAFGAGGAGRRTW